LTKLPEVLILFGKPLIKLTLLLCKIWAKLIVMPKLTYLSTVWCKLTKN